MSKGIFPDVSVAFLLLNLSFNPVYSQVVGSQSERVMFYNVENVFDIYDDSLTQDNDFLPDGLMKWNLSRYNKKINSLYKTIIAAGEWEPPAVVALCEIARQWIVDVP